MPRYTPDILFRLSDPALWEQAGWSGTTFRWHPTGEQPPVMGVVFDDADAGRAIFKDWQALVGGCVDRFEEIRVSVVDGTDPPGYFVHLGPDPGNVTARATTEDFVMPPNLVWLTRLNWMRRVPGSEDLLAPFRDQYEVHGEFMLAPVTRRKDGLLRFDLVLGVIKRNITFRSLSSVREGNDPDAPVLQAGRALSSED